LNRQLKIRLIITVGLLLAILVNASCVPVQTFDRRLGSIVRSYTFSIVRWELTTIPHEVKGQIFGRHGGLNEVDVVKQYFSAVEQIKTLESELEAINAGNRQGDAASLEAELDGLRQQKVELAAAVERIISQQIREVLTQQGIFNPVIKLKVNFPPLNFKLDKPPHILVVSPRNRIEMMREITLKQSLGLEEMEDIEAQVDELGVSSLVVRLGGFGGTYPSFVTDNGNLKFTIDTAVEEWLHQYLAFKPLGFLYLLDLTGVSRNYEIVTMNETVAGMVSKEIGSIVYNKYYSDYGNGAARRQGQDKEFNREMRQIRLTVDEYLAQRKIEQAEKFMEEKRQYLVSKGYHIRRLNQAYFAFYGTYADRPTSISPIGVELKQLREQSASLRDFLDRVSGMTSRDDLKRSIE
jgi:cell division inhibitor SulA